MRKLWQNLLSSGPPKITLSADDLQEFLLRRATLNNAKFQALMVEESYQLWSKNLRAKYNLPTKFEIDPVTGVVTGKGES
jgi:hypothetical protein